MGEKAKGSAGQEAELLGGALGSRKVATPALRRYVGAAAGGAAGLVGRSEATSEGGRLGKRVLFQAGLGGAEKALPGRVCEVSRVNNCLKVRLGLWRLELRLRQRHVTDFPRAGVVTVGAGPRVPGRLGVSVKSPSWGKTVGRNHLQLPDSYVGSQPHTQVRLKQRHRTKYPRIEDIPA